MSWSDVFLSLAVQYTPVIVPVSMFLGGVGIPLPNSMITIILGTLIQQELLSPLSPLLYVVTPTVLGDLTSVLIARKLLRSNTFASLSTFLKVNSSVSEQHRATHFFRKYGDTSIVLSRCIFTPLAVPINVIVASSCYSLQKFFLLDLVGELIWAGMYAAIGYFFGLQWQLIYQLLNNFTGLITMVAVILLVIAVQSKRKKLKASAHSEPEVVRT